MLTYGISKLLILTLSKVPSKHSRPGTAGINRRILKIAGYSDVDYCHLNLSISQGTRRGSCQFESDYDTFVELFLDQLFCFKQPHGFKRQPKPGGWLVHYVTTVDASEMLTI